MKYSHLLSSILFLLAYSTELIFSQTIIPEGTVSGNWSLLNSPYLIEGNITITDDSSLTIEPGVTVEFQGHFEFNVHGVLLAIGNETDSITFTVSDTIGFTNIETTLGGWNGFNFRNVLSHVDTSKFVFCKIEYCKNAAEVWPDNSGGAMLIENSANLQISNTLFQYNFANWGGAIGMVNGVLNLKECTFQKNRSSFIGGVIAADLSEITIDKCSFLYNHSEFQSGGIHAWKCNLRISESFFIENSSEINYGAICADSCSVIIDNTLFESNSSVWGGGLATNYGSLNLTNSQFIDNNAEHGGGLISGWNKNHLSNVIFKQNSANWGGAMSMTNCDLNIIDCIYQKNQADESGAFEYIADTLATKDVYDVNIVGTTFLENNSTGAVGTFRFIQIGTEESLVNIDIDQCNIVNNSADRVNVAISSYVKDFKISNSILNGNNTTRRTSGCAFSDNVTGTVENCLFNSNFTSGGSSAVSVGQNSSVNFTNCTFANNHGENGGAVTLRNNGNILLMNSILWGNNPYNSVLAAVTDSTPCVLDIYYSDIQYGKDSLLINDSISVINWGTGNIEANPLFVDSLINFSLMDNSPCIGAGIDSILINESWYYSPQNDITGNTRPLPESSIPDIGAYENRNGIPTDVKDNKVIPKKFELSQNYPNPFNPATRIQYCIPVAVPSNVEGPLVTLKIFDLLGREVATLVNEKQQPGSYTIEFNSSDLTSGVYFYRLLILGNINSLGSAANQQIGSGKIFAETKKMVILK